LEFRNQSQSDPDLFAQTLLRTYENSLDCPEVNGVRTIDEIIAGHQAQGIFHPERWWLVVESGQAVAVLLLIEMRAGEGWEISYLGVVPEARGRGIGVALALHALHAAYAAEAPQLTLSVDVRNQPAWRVYKGTGFEAYDERRVYLAILQ
jgi:ribosomal protein S18 acetylase RimI-like enzyme